MNDPKDKLDLLKKSLESGVIDKEEFEKPKQELESEIKDIDEKREEKNEPDVPEEEPKKSSEIILIVSIVILVLLFAAIFAFRFFNQPEALTLDELHVLNLKGDLKPEQGYLYKGVYSFISFDNLWYMQLTSPKGTKEYSLALRYSPRDVEDIVIEGNLDGEFFNEKDEFYVTFDPTGNDFSSVTLAVSDFNTHMSRVFEKRPVAACDRNETFSCLGRPIVTCDDSDKVVLYIKESERFRAYYNENCIVVEGSGFDLVRGVDRILYNLYNIMEQEEI